ncbi:RfaG Glycosyltransferase [Burkholderiales bacterium]
MTEFPALGSTGGYILWLGVGELSNPNGDSSNAAASFWQRQFIESLSSLGRSVVVVSHVVRPRWPKSDLFVKGSHTHCNANSFYQVSYLNFILPRTKNNSLVNGYLEVVNDIIRDRGAPKLIICYNLFPHTLSILQNVDQLAPNGAILIMADRPHPSLFPVGQDYSKIYRSFFGVAFLSWADYKVFVLDESINAIHFEGGIKEVLPINAEGYVAIDTSMATRYDGGSTVVMFCGSAGDHAGLSIFLASASFINTKNVEFWIAGGWNGNLNAIRSGSVKVRKLGFLSEDKLEYYLSRSDIFVNTNLSTASQNKHNFPSKLLRYLSFKKPIISTWTEGLPPYYRGMINVVDSDSPEKLAEMIDYIAKRPKDGLAPCRRNLASFVDNHYWKRRVEFFLSWGFSSSR